MKKTGFYLLTDASVLCSYLVARWIEQFENHPSFCGIVVREKRPEEQVLQARHAFHEQHAGQRELSEQQWKTLADLYPAISDAEQATIQALAETYGLSPYAVSHHPDTIFLDHNVNSTSSRDWLQSISQTKPWLFSCIGQIFKPWWVEMMSGRLVNTHTAVLPYARGIYTIENLAATQDIALFQQAVGFTVHYIDADVDTGAIIRAERVAEPFRFGSLWDLKSYVYMASFDNYVHTADTIINNPNTIPAGVVPNPALQGRNFKTKDFSMAKRQDAEQGYLAMKARLAE